MICWAYLTKVLISMARVILLLSTPLKSKMEPEKKSLEKEILLGNHHFQVPCQISGEYA